MNESRKGRFCFGKSTLHGSFIVLLCGIASLLLHAEMTNSKPASQEGSRIKNIDNQEGSNEYDPLSRNLDESILLTLEESEQMGVLKDLIGDQSNLLSTCVAELGSKTKQTLQALPGTTHVGSSINAITGIRSNLFDAQGYDKNYICAPGYRCPDAIHSISFREREFRSGADSSSKSFESTITEQQRSLSATLSVSGGNKAFKMSISASYSSTSKWMLEESKKESKKYSRFDHLVQKYSYKLAAEQKLTENSMGKLMEVAKAINSTDAGQARQKAVHFISEYGTHIMTHEPVGGYLDFAMSFESSAYDSVKRSSHLREGCLEVAAQMRYGFLKAKVEASVCGSQEAKREATQQLEEANTHTQFFSKPQLEGNLEDPIAIENWKANIHESPQPIDPWVGQRIRDEYDSVEIWTLMKFIHGEQLEQISEYTPVNTMTVELESAYKDYLEFFDAQNCGNICLNNGKAFVSSNFDPDLALPFQHPTAHCGCICELGTFGQFCDGEVYTENLSTQDLKQLVYDRCSLNVELRTNGATAQNIHVALDHDLTAGDTLLPYIGDVDGGDSLVFGINCDQTCDDTSSRCYEGSTLSNALSELGNICMKVGWENNGHLMETTTCSDDGSSSSLVFNSDVNVGDALYFETFVKGYTSQMNNLLRSLRLFVAECSSTLWSNTNCAGADLTFDHQTCNAFLRESECVPLASGYSAGKFPIRVDAGAGGGLKFRWYFISDFEEKFGYSYSK